MSNTVAVCKTAIVLLALVHPLLRYPVTTPINVWNIITVIGASLELDHIVIPLLKWLRDQTSAHTGTVGALSTIDLANVTIQARK